MVKRLVLAVAACVMCAACAAPSEPSPSPAVHELPARSAADQLSSLPGRPEVTVPGYDRDLFGDSWVDEDQDCQDSRNEVLARDLQAVSFSDAGCKVLAGRLQDLYTGKLIPFQRGPDTSDDVQIDHRWPLSAAWQAGAAHWTPEQRERFANDLDELVAVDGSTNNAKRDRLPDRWLPPNLAYRCDYVTSVIAVGVKYRLAITDRERRGFAHVLDGCAAAR